MADREYAVTVGGETFCVEARNNWEARRRGCQVYRRVHSEDKRSASELYREGIRVRVLDDMRHVQAKIALTDLPTFAVQIFDKRYRVCEETSEKAMQKALKLYSADNLVQPHKEDIKVTPV